MLLFQTIRLFSRNFHHSSAIAKEIQNAAAVELLSDLAVRIIYKRKTSEGLKAQSSAQFTWGEVSPLALDPLFIKDTGSFKKSLESKKAKMPHP